MWMEDWRCGWCQGEHWSAIGLGCSSSTLFSTAGLSLIGLWTGGANLERTLDGCGHVGLQLGTGFSSITGSVRVGRGVSGGGVGSSEGSSVRIRWHRDWMVTSLSRGPS